MLSPLVPSSAGTPVRVTISFDRAVLGASASREGEVGSARLSRGAGPLGAVISGTLHGPGGGSDPASGSKAAAWVLERYAAVGIEVFRELSGEFCLALWDEADGSLHLATDPFRTQPLFYRVS